MSIVPYLAAPLAPLNRLVFGPVAIEWDAAVPFPLAIDHTRLNGLALFITLCWIRFRFGGLMWEVPAGFVFDGATIPRWLWWIPGFAPLGKHIWAALLHDRLCQLARDNPDLMDRTLADAAFASLLEHTAVGKWRALAMDLAVSGYRRWNFLRGTR